jgi:hypothetical protein
VAFPAAASAETASPVATIPSSAHPIENRLEVGAPPHAKSGIERTMTRLFLFVLLLGVLAGVFYAGRKYKGAIPYIDQSENVTAVASPTVAPVTGDDPLLKFERGRREVDNDPNVWLASRLPSELSRQSLSAPLDSNDAEFLYLYGRASLLAGNTDEAARAFDAALTKASLVSPQANATLKKEAVLGLAAVALKSDKDKPAALARFDEVLRQPSSSASPLGSPSLSP